MLNTMIKYALALERTVNMQLYTKFDVFFIIKCQIYKLKGTSHSIESVTI